MHIWLNHETFVSMTERFLSEYETLISSEIHISRKKELNQLFEQFSKKYYPLGWESIWNPPYYVTKPSNKYDYYIKIYSRKNDTCRQIIKMFELSSDDKIWVDEKTVQELEEVKYTIIDLDTIEDSFNETKDKLKLLLSQTPIERKNNTAPLIDNFSDTARVTNVGPWPLIFLGAIIFIIAAMAAYNT